MNRDDSVLGKKLNQKEKKTLKKDKEDLERSELGDEEEITP